MHAYQFKRPRYVRPENCEPRMRCTQCHANRRIKTGFRVQIKRGKDYVTKVCKTCEKANALERWRASHPGCVPARVFRGRLRDKAEVRKRGAAYLETGVYGISLEYRAWVGDRRVQITRSRS